jgi:hypothetical protein
MTDQTFTIRKATSEDTTYIQDRIYVRHYEETALRSIAEGFVGTDGYGTSFSVDYLNFGVTVFEKGLEIAHAAKDAGLHVVGAVLYEHNNVPPVIHTESMTVQVQLDENREIVSATLLSATPAPTSIALPAPMISEDVFWTVSLPESEVTSIPFGSPADLFFDRASIEELDGLFPNAKYNFLFFGGSAYGTLLSELIPFEVELKVLLSSESSEESREIVETYTVTAVDDYHAVNQAQGLALAKYGDALEEVEHTEVTELS